MLLRPYIAEGSCHDEHQNRRFCIEATDPYFFSSQEDAKLTDIHTEVKRSIESATDELTFEVDLSLMKQAEAVLAETGWTLEEATVLFLYWLAVRPEDAKAWNDQFSAH